MAHAVRTPATMRVRLAVRHALRAMKEQWGEDQRLPPLSAQSLPRLGPLVLVALSGGADSLALAAAAALEAKSVGVNVGAVVVDHALQTGSAEVAMRAARQAEALGLAPVVVRLVDVGAVGVSRSGGIEAAARLVRYDALALAAADLGARWVVTAHTRDDQAEQVLLALARGSGTRSIAGIPPVRELSDSVRLVRPLLDERFEITRQTTLDACAELGLTPWHDPHNADTQFARVRVRTRVLPMLDAELGQGITNNLARSADLAREDADALDAWVQRVFETIMADSAAGDAAADASGDVSNGLSQSHTRTCAVAIEGLCDVPAAVRNRVIRRIVSERFGSHLTREHTLAVASLVTAWKGQGPILVPGAAVHRSDSRLVFRATNPNDP